MRNLLMAYETWLIWGLFISSSVFGHVALKLAMAEDGSKTYSEVFSAVLTPWGISAMASWTVSLGLWMIALSKYPLIDASAVSTLRYAGISLAACVFLKEAVSAQQVFGIVLIIAGTSLVTAS